MKSKKARQIARYQEWKRTGPSDDFQHFEVYGIYPPKRAGSPSQLRRVGRQLVPNATIALERAHKGLSASVEKGGTLFILERFDPNKGAVLAKLRTRLAAR